MIIIYIILIMIIMIIINITSMKKYFEHPLS